MAAKQLLSRTQLNLLLALLAGAALPLAFAPFSFYPLAVLSPAILFYIWLGGNAKQAAVTGYVFGMGLFGVGVSWVYVAVHDFGFSSMPLAVLLTALFVTALALCMALQGYISVWFRIRLHHASVKNTVVILAVFPAVWVLQEWFRSWFLTGFPWLNLGYSQVDSILKGYAPLWGVFGVSLITVLISALILLLLLNKDRKRQIQYFIAIISLVLGGYFANSLEFTQGTGEKIRVSLIQGNQPQITKWDADALQQRLDTYAGLTRDNWDSQLIIWPENSVTTFVHYLEDYFTQLQQDALKNNTDIIIGAPVLDQETKQYYSSMLALGKTPGQYNKRHLVPFGEFMPLDFMLRGLIDFFDLPMSSFSSGSHEQTLLHGAGQPLAISICYEDAFGDEVLKFLPEATLLVNGSNNAWYGDSFAPHQHLQISRMRAQETGRALLRVTTNGISAIVNHKGDIESRSPQFETYVLQGTVQPRQGVTPYIRFGNYPVVLLIFSMLGLFGYKSRSQ